MLISLDQSLIDAMHSYTNEEISHLEDLLNCHSKKYHYVGSTRRIANALRIGLEGKLSRRSAVTLVLIATQSESFLSLTEVVQVYASVTRGHLAGMILTLDNSQSKWSCDLAYASKWFSQPSKIIGEHLTDSKIYRASARHFGLRRGLDTRMQKFSLDMSGGSGNADCMMANRIAEASSPVLCIIDSDKLAADREPSGSVKKCIDVIDKMKGISYFFALNERELENLIPSSLIQKAILLLNPSFDRDAILERAVLANVVRTDHPSLYKYVDLKEGTCRTWINKKNLDKFFQFAPVIMSCECTPTCDGKISPRIFDELLVRVSEVLENISNKKLSEEVVNATEEEWFNVGALVYAMGLSNNIQPT